MSDILGHDIDGKLIRPGDRFVILNARFVKWNGMEFTALPRSQYGYGGEEGLSYLEDVFGGRYVVCDDGMAVMASKVRLIKPQRLDHEASTESFHDIMASLKSTQPASREVS